MPCHVSADDAIESTHRLRSAADLTGQPLAPCRAVTNPWGELVVGGSLLSNGGLEGVPVVVPIKTPENPMMPPSMYIVLKMLFPIKNGASGGGVDDHVALDEAADRRWKRHGDRRVLEGVEVQRQDVGAGSRSLGRLADEPEVAADREDGSIGKLDVAADVEQVQVATDEDAGSRAAQVDAIEHVESVHVAAGGDRRAGDDAGKGDPVDRGRAV